MGMRKDYYLREAAQALAMVKAVYLHDLVFVRKLVHPSWPKRAMQVTPGELDDVGIRVRVHDDTYNFVQEGPDKALSSCAEVVDQWRIEALDKIEAKETSVVALAAACNISRQSLYRVVRGTSSGLQYLYTLRGRTPILQWRGRRLEVEYARCRGDLESNKLMERLV